MCRQGELTEVQETVEYRTERSEGGYAAKALARRAADRMLPKASRRENKRHRRGAVGRTAAVDHGP